MRNRRDGRGRDHARVARGDARGLLGDDRKPGSETPWTKQLWIYDLRTNQHFTLKTNPLQRTDLDELVLRDKCSLDLFWLRDESLEASENLPEPDVIAAEIAEDLRAALEEFEEVANDLRGPVEP